MAKKTPRQNIRFISGFSAILLLWYTLGIFSQAIGVSKDFFAARQALGADFGQSLAFTSGIGNMLAWYCYFGILAATVAIFIVFFRSETPFTPKLPPLIKLISVLMMISGVGALWIAQLLYHLQLKRYMLLPYDLDLLSASCERFGDPGYAFMILGLAYIFEHGLKLQQENDETL